MRTIFFHNEPKILGSFGVGGKDESKSPYCKHFDTLFNDDYWGEDTFELCERKMYINAVQGAIGSAGLNKSDIDILFGGDLLNQIISASYSAREMETGFLGLYGACSAMAESLLISGVFIDGGYAKNCIAATSSHFATAQRQFRTPLGLGSTDTPTAQITATAAGACVVGLSGAGIAKVSSATVGRVVDFGITDATNMGAAMVPAALETVITHLENTNTKPENYDLIVTGDLGIFGRDLFLDNAKKLGYVFENYTDCGAEIYKGNKNAPCGASGCGCSALMLCSYYLDLLKKRELKKILFCATGALMSPLSTFQGESIPGVAHAVCLEAI